MLVLTSTFLVAVLGRDYAQQGDGGIASLVNFVFGINVAMMVVLGCCVVWDYRWVVREGHNFVKRASSKKLRNSSSDLEMHDMPDVEELQIRGNHPRNLLFEGRPTAFLVGLPGLT